MRSARVFVPLVLLFAVSIGTSAAHAAQRHYTIKYGTAYVPTDPNTLAAVEFQRMVQRESKGQITVTVYPDNQLGTQQDQLTQVQGDSIQIADSASSYLEAYVPQFGLLNLPFLFGDEAKAKAALDGPGGTALNTLLVHKTGISVLTWQNIGFAQLITSQAVTTAAALQGMKLRDPGDPVSTAIIKDIGAVPVSVDGAEVATALEQGLAAGSFLPINFIYGQKLTQIDPYIAKLNFLYYGSPVVINEKFYKSLPKRLQLIVTGAAQWAAEGQWVASATFEKQSISAMAAGGAHISTFPVAARAKLVKDEQPLYSQLKQQFGKSVLNKLLKSASRVK